ncbi:GNAT family N-acetyltransferase [Kitasatospora sp. NPDC002227]|uniref:GNAT family N-acetyltransferase n=1 Tax=Kitasatospora sp. NPDC002227 TaxID=3154773 RepID=UPI00332DE4A7
MSNDQLRAVSEFLCTFSRRQAATVVEAPGGFAVLDERYPHSQADNQLMLHGPVDPELVPELAERLLGHLPYRRIGVADQELGQACVPALTRAGYHHGTVLVMAHSGPTPPAGPAEVVGLAELRPALAQWLRTALPAAEPAVLRDLAERRVARLRGAEEVLFLAARDTDGTIGSWADLYLEPADGIAQFEDLVTAWDRTRRGLADAVLTSALARAGAAGCGFRFLLADPADWPRHWYARRGFTPIGHFHDFSRQP